MRTLWMKSTVAAVLCLFVTSAQAQYRRDDRRYDGYRDDRSRAGREPLDRVRADLERAMRDSRYLSRDDMKRMDKVRQEINQFQNKWERGRFDRHELDDVINSLQKVIDRNRLDPRDRNMLLNDSAQLREFRSRGGMYR
jgi:hypothetical protein